MIAIPKKMMQKRIDPPGMITLQASRNAFFSVSSIPLFAKSGLKDNLESPTLFLGLFSLNIKILLSFITWDRTRTRNTRNGANKPCSNQMSIILKLESMGKFLEILSYRVYMTKVDVRATMIVTSK